MNKISYIYVVAQKRAVAFVKLSICLIISTQLSAQMGDSLNIDNVVVTATRTERKLSNVAVPTTLVTQKTIQQLGSLRLKDVLQEQTGLFLTSGFGVGVQMQGLASSYTLILVDGEPLVGRTSGILDLNRLSVGNIKKIEIVKGPSSSLYGSEALAGVINIITDRNTKPKLSVGVRYGLFPYKAEGKAVQNFNTADININASTTYKKFGINYFFNNYNTDGFSVRPFSVDRAVNPIWRLTNQVNIQYPISLKIKANLNIRYNYEYIKNELSTPNNGVTVISKGRERNSDWNITPSITYTHGNQYKNTTRAYATIYNGSQKLEVTNGVGYDDQLRNQFYRLENQSDITHIPELTITAGMGAIREIVNSTRYDNASNAKQNRVYYAFAQAEYRPLDSLTIIGGARFDDNLLYQSAFSPKLALNFRPSKYISMNASYGRGFRAPDFRQLYLNFTNSAAGGYSVYGSLEVVDNIKRLTKLNDIEGLLDDYNKLQTLRPEFSNGLNFGVNIKPTKGLQLTLNAFRNDITDLIDVRLVAIKKNSAQIYSYINVNKAFTQGIESNLNYTFLDNWTVSGGYQYLQNGDKDEIKLIRAKGVYTKDATGATRLLTLKEYRGLPNRSAHQANLRFQYEHKNTFFVNARVIYRSKWAVQDKNGNGVIDNGDTFADAYYLLNMAAGKTINKHFRLQGGIDNVLNYADAYNLPNQAGRTFYTTVNYTF